MELTQEQEWDYSPYFDQENPQVDIIGKIAELDLSPAWELEAIGVFKAAKRGYLVVYVSGCSCWPDRGGTTQYYCTTRAEAQQAIREHSDYQDFAPLIDKLQEAKWKLAQL